MAAYGNLMTLFVVLVLGALCEASQGIHPDLTIERANEIFNNKERLAELKACFEFGTNCNPVFQNVVDAFPELYKTACANCDERERTMFRAGTRKALLTDPQYFKRVVDKFDKEGIYWPAYMQFVLND